MKGEQKVEQPAVHFAGLPRVVSAVNRTILFLAIAATPLIFSTSTSLWRLGGYICTRSTACCMAACLFSRLADRVSAPRAIFLVLFFFVVGLAGYCGLCFRHSRNCRYC